MSEEDVREIKRLSKEKNREVSDVRLLETMKAIRLATRIETYLTVFMVLLNLLALFIWYLSDYALGSFLAYYLTIGLAINICIILIHNKWEDKYISTKASRINNEISMIKMEYNARIKRILDNNNIQ
ncbi:MAG: hypothetical protein IKR19_07435 [Acholeplasmatales bacterium]|nr:hypothetical protein [Acholeplasmatales bacterium]